MFNFQEFSIFQHLLLWIAIFLGFRMYIFSKMRKFILPPGPRGLPIVGILPFIKKNSHLKLYNLSKKYGDVFSVYLGRTYTVVISDAEIGKEILSRSSASDRPPYMFPLMPDGVGLAENNGPEWIEQRRYVITQMKNLGLGTSHWEKLVQMEVSDVVETISKAHGKPTEINSLIYASVSNNITSFLINQRLPLGHPKRGIIEKGIASFQHLHNPCGLSVHFPNFFKFLVDCGFMKVGEEMENIMNLNKYIRQEIQESKERGECESFIDKYLAEIVKKKMTNQNTFNERNLIGSLQALFIGGSDTSYVSIMWLLLAMASFPQIQRKVQEELDSVLGKDGPVDWLDRDKLPYCMATIMEGQRWRTIAPINIVHRVNEDTVLNGYDIPKGTNILALFWAFHHDSKYWKDPDVFKPERFLSDDQKTIKEQDAYVPFSYGKRVCPGKRVAHIELFYYFVCIMQKFQVLPEHDGRLPDLEGFLCFALQPKRQSLRFTPR